MRILAVIALLLLAGCQTAPNRKVALIQQVLDALLPPSFVGDFDGGENVPMYVSFTLVGRNLIRTDAGWTFTYLKYDRAGPIGTSAHIELGKRP